MGLIEIAKRRIARNVVILGFVSMLNDIASEMVYPLLPIFLTSVVNTPVAIIGLIEGIADASTSLLKLLSGVLSDRLKKKKLLVMTGYFFGAIAKPILALSHTWQAVLSARVIDRTGKGIRTSPRDAIISDSTTGINRGISFGFHRAMDSLGAFIGPLLALLILQLSKNNIRLVFMIAFIPALLSLFVLIPVKEKRYRMKRREKFVMSRGAVYFLIVLFIFSVGNSSDAFIILRAKQQGFSIVSVMLAYALFNIIYSFSSTFAGMLYDRIGRIRSLAIGFSMFSVAYFIMAFFKGYLIWLMFILYGVVTAMIDGNLRASMSSLSGRMTGTSFGVFHAVNGTGVLAASIIGGLLWQYISPASVFIYGAITSFSAAALIMLTPMILGMNRQYKKAGMVK